MKTQSNTQPQVYEIINLGNGQAEVLFSENVTVTEDGFEYDLYVITTPYRDNLDESISGNFAVWLAYAKDSQPTESYTAEQLLQQDISDLQIENIEQGQQITDLELTVLGGVE